MSDFIIHSDSPFDLTLYRPPKGGKELYNFEITKLVTCKICQLRDTIECPLAFIVPDPRKDNDYCSWAVGKEE